MTNIGSLEVLLKLKDELSSAITKVTPAMTALEGAAANVGSSLGKVQSSMNEATLGMGRGAQKMLAMQVAAQNMDNQFGSLNDRAQIMSKNIELVGQSITQMGAASGITKDTLSSLGVAGQTVITAGNALGPAAAIAAVGIDTIKTAAIGLNATVIGLVLAAFALGSAIGKWLDQFKVVRDAVDAVTGALVRLFQGQEAVNAQAAATHGIAQFSANIAAQHTEALKKQHEAFAAGGVHTQAYKDHIERLTDAQKTMLGVSVPQIKATKEIEEAQKKAAAAAKEWASGIHEANIAGKEYIETFENEALAAERLRIEFEELAVAALQAAEYEAEHAREMDIAAEVAGYAEIAAYELAAATEEEGRAIDEVNQKLERKRQLFAELSGLAGALANLGDVVGGAFGDIASAAGDGAIELLNFDYAAARAGSTMEKVAGVVNGAAEAWRAGGDATISTARATMQGAVAGAKAGAAFGPWGVAIGAVAGGLVSLTRKLGLFGDAVIMAINDQRDAFFEAHGGFEQLGTDLGGLGLTADEAGEHIRALFEADTPEEYAAAVAAVNAEFAEAADRAKALEEGTDKVKDAMERYGLTIDQMGPRFAQQQLDEQAMKLVEDYALLIAAGADMNTVLAAMAPAMNEYVQTVIASGGTVPEAMRAQIEEMIRLGLLVDENGVAYTSAADAGITFAETVSEAIGRAADAIERLVAALTGIPRDVDVNVNTHHTQSGNPPQGGGPPPPELPEFAHGTGGFRDFGAGTPAILHGTEAVVTPQQANAMIQGGGGGSAISSAQLDQVVAALVRGVRDGVLLAQR